MAAFECTSSPAFFTAPASVRGGKCFIRHSTSRPHMIPEKYQSLARLHLTASDILKSSVTILQKKSRHFASGVHHHYSNNNNNKGLLTPKWKNSINISTTGIPKLNSVVCQVTTHRGNEAVMRQKIKAHSGPLTSIVVLGDGQGGRQKIVTASLDKTLAFWSLHENRINEDQLLSMRMHTNDTIFTLAKDSERIKSGSNSVFCGTALSKSIRCWEPPVGRFVPKVNLNGHSGWVRALASSGRWLFSSDCNNLRLWDLSWAVPRNLNHISLFKGEILHIALSNHQVYVACDDGSIRSWDISKNGDLKPSRTKLNAHQGRITGLLWHNNILYSIGRDGHLKSWNGETLSLRSIARHAHNCEKVNCMSMGPDNVLYTGGDDGLVRRWNAKTLQASHSPLFCHSTPVRTLATGTVDTLVSGDASGFVTVWKI